MDYKRLLKLESPMMRGDDVLALQEELVKKNFTVVGKPDGIFGNNTDKAVRQYQESANLDVDGKVGKNTWNALFAEPKQPAPSDTQVEPTMDWLGPLVKNHNFNGGVSWRLGRNGIQIEDNPPEITRGAPQTVERIWTDYGQSIRKWAKEYDVPVELIIATIGTETSGQPQAVREEPGFTSDDETPHRISAGLMQTLISTAREALNDNSVDRHWLFEPDNAIKAGTAYISRQRRKTELDPPKVACAYNAGGVYADDCKENRWKMKQYPIGTGEHADRFVKWFNDCFRLFDQNQERPDNSFRALV